MNQNRMNQRIAIIIPTFNREKELRCCLNHIQMELQNTSNHLVAVYVSDDSQNKDFQNEIKLDYPFVSIFSGPGKGPASNRNFAVNNTLAEWIIFLDDDCIPQTGFLNSYLSAFLKSEHLLFEGKTISDRPKERFDETAPINLLGGKLWSCNFAIHKDLFLKIGGFDIHYPTNTMEDIDFKERVLPHSKPQFLSDALVIHPWRKRIPFKNLDLRIKSQQYFAVKFGYTKKMSFRINRIKIFVGSIYLNLKELIGFSLKGWECYLDKMVFNFLMIFI
jgi:GT2 family glycosyltransferase